MNKLSSSMDVRFAGKRSVAVQTNGLQLKPETRWYFDDS
jgi:hypothetical protein